MTDDIEDQEAVAKAIGHAKHHITIRRAQYHRTFIKTGVDGHAVLEDLAKFCRAHDSTFDPNPTISDRLDGRREVWLRIQQHLQLSDSQLWQLYKIPG